MKRKPLLPPDQPIRTMQDLATYVGLTRQTLSKYFRDPGSISASSRQRIEEGIAFSDFQPNFFAANLKRQRSKVLGIIIPSTVDPFYMELVGRIEWHASEAGFFVLTLSSGGRYDMEVEAIKRLRALNAAGLFIASSGVPREYSPLPVVYLDSSSQENGPFVGTDNVQSITQMVTYLCQSGEPPCYLGMPSINQNAEKRLQAYIQAMDALGYEPQVLSLRGKISWDFESYGYRNAASRLRSGLPTNTLLCGNDRIAIGAQLAAWQAGLRVGKREGCELRIAGHDDHPFSRYTNPPLTTMVQNTDLMARHAVDIMRSLCGELPVSEVAQQIMIPATLVIRDSA